MTLNVQLSYLFACANEEGAFTIDLFLQVLARLQGFYVEGQQPLQSSIPNASILVKFDISYNNIFGPVPKD